MDEQFDKDLKDRIKEVFENIDDSSAGEGWLQLRKKFPEEAARRPFAWVWRGAAAAILLMFLGIGLWIKNEQVKPENSSHKTVRPAQPGNLATVKDHHDTIGKTKSGNKENLSETTVDKVPVTKLNPSKTLASVKNNIQPSIVAPLFSNGIPSKNSLAAKKTVDSSKTIINKASVQQAAVTAQQNTITVQQSAVTVQQNTVNTNPIPVMPQPPAKSIASMLAEDYVVSPKKGIDKYKNYTKRVNFGVYATTYFNYARGSNNQVNAGAGITSDIAISKHLKLVTGVAIAQNTLNYSGSGSVYSNINSTGIAPSSSANVYIASAGAAGTNVPKVASFAVVATPTFKNYNASLIGLDVPLNLKYEFNPQKNDLYVSAGLSSGTFVNETYTYQYNSPSFFSSSVQKTLGETTNRRFNGFYFAKTLNVAFGVGYPFRKNRIVIEPFLKYPLQGLGSQQIRFGAGGVNLKFNFESLRK